MSKTESTKTPPTSLRALALTASSAFRTKVITVPEWDGVTVKLREPSGEGWVRWKEIVSPEIDEGEEPPKLTPQESFIRSRAADVVMFIDILLDENGDHVFSSDDESAVAEIYGPVHVRLLNQAIALGTSQDFAAEK